MASAPAHIERSPPPPPKDGQEIRSRRTEPPPKKETCLEEDGHEIRSVEDLKGRLFNTLMDKVQDGGLDEVIEDVVASQVNRIAQPDGKQAIGGGAEALSATVGAELALQQQGTALSDLNLITPYSFIEAISMRDQRIGQLRWAMEDVIRSIGERKEYCAQLEAEVACVSRSLENITKEHDLKRRALEKSEFHREELEASFQKAVHDLGSSSLKVQESGVASMMSTNVPSLQYGTSEMDSTCTGGTAFGGNSPSPTVSAP
jgi:hypothetical protein